MRSYPKIQWHKNKIMSCTFSGWLGVGQDGPRWLTPRCTPDLLHVFLIFLGRGGYQNHVFPTPTTKTLDQLETQCVLTYKLQTRTLPLLPTFQWAKQITQPSLILTKFSSTGKYTLSLVGRTTMLQGKGCGYMEGKGNNNAIHFIGQFVNINISSQLVSFIYLLLCDIFTKFLYYCN